MRAHPERKRARAKEPKPRKGLGSPPAGLSPDAIAVWMQMEAETVPGVLTVSDRLAAEVWCMAVARYRDGSATNKDVTLLAKGFAWFGLTPSDRSRVQVESQGSPEDSVWRDLLDTSN